MPEQVRMKEPYHKPIRSDHVYDDLNRLSVGLVREVNTLFAIDKLLFRKTPITASEVQFKKDAK